MKRYTVAFMSTMMVLIALSGIGNALVFTDTQVLNRTVWGSGTTSWTHTVTSDFSVPYDTINSATLEIFASAINGTNDSIYVEGTLQGILQNQQWVWSWNPFPGYYEGSTFNIADVFTSWTAGDILNVSLTYNEPWYGLNLNLCSSVFTLDYENSTGNGAAPVPEPATLLLLGSGLLGIAGFRKKMK